MREVVYFILTAMEEPVIYLKVPLAFSRETWAYISEYTMYVVEAVTSVFVDEPEEITPLDQFLSEQLEETLRRYWHRLWVSPKKFSQERLSKLARKGQWEKIESLVWAVKKREIEDAAPHRIYRIPATGPTLSGSLPPGSEIILDKKAAEGMSEDELGKEIPLEKMLLGERQRLEQVMADMTKTYEAGRKILDQLPGLDGRQRGE